MADFKTVFDKVVANEGFYSNDPDDDGGETYRGVARKSNPDWEGWRIIDEYKKEHGKIKWNTRIPSIILDVLVEQLYRERYWRPMRGNLIASDWVAAVLFDMYINSGSAVKLMQRTLNRLGVRLEEDNKMGPNTLNAMNLISPDRLVKEYNEERVNFYRMRVIQKPSNLKYLHGWLARVHRFDKGL